MHANSDFAFCTLKKANFVPFCALPPFGKRCLPHISSLNAGNYTPKPSSKVATKPYLLCFAPLATRPLPPRPHPLWRLTVIVVDGVQSISGNMSRVKGCKHGMHLSCSAAHRSILRRHLLCAHPVLVSMLRSCPRLAYFTHGDFQKLMDPLLGVQKLGSCIRRSVFKKACPLLSLWDEEVQYVAVHQVME